MNQVQHKVDQAREHLNYLFNHLQKYLQEVKTCRQLNLAVPAGVSTDTNDVHIDAVTIYALENVPCDSSLQLLCGNYSPTHDYYSRVAPRKVDIILFNIRQYFKDVTTRRQLALDVLAGFL